MRITSIISALIMTICFVSCSESETDGPTPKPIDETKSIYLQIASPQKSGLRSNEASAVGDTAYLESAIIYFLDGSADPVIYDVRTVGNNGANITVEQLKEGYYFEGIPSYVTQVYIVGNYNSSDTQGNAPTFPMDDGQTLSEIEEVVLNIEQVAHGALLDGTTVPFLLTVMDGRAAVEEYDTSSNNWNGDEDLTDGDLYAEVLLIPVNSRIEIQQISYSGDLMSFTLEGIYINNYYQNLPLTLDRDGYAPTNNGANVNYYNVDQSNPDFAYREYMTLYDILNIPGVPVNEEAVFTPSNGTWAYHVFGNSSPVPHIILKLTGVVTASGTSLGDRYLTVRGFRNGSGQEIMTFERNTIYRITDLAFTNDDLDIYPETEAISIWVHVEVAPWELVDVSPII